MTNHNSKTYQTLKYLFIVISSIALLNCGGGSSSGGGSVGNNDGGDSGEPVPSGKYYKFQNGVVEGVDFETNSIKNGAVSTDKGFTYNVGDKTITFKIKNLIIGEININDIPTDKILLVSDIVGVERDDTVNKDVLKILRVLHSLDNDNDLSNGIFIDDTTKNKLVVSEGKTKITENTIADLKALMVKAGKELVVEKKSRDYYKENVLTPLNITPKFNPFTLEVKTTSANESFTFQATGFTYDYTVDWGDDSDIETGITTEAMGTHTYAKAGTYIIKVSGKFPYLLLNSSEKTKITKVLAWGDVAWITFSSVFRGMNAKFSTTDTPDLSEVKGVSNMFSNLKTANIDFIEDWDVSKVENMSGMFENAKQFNDNISSWDVSSATDMTEMFHGSTNFNQDLSDWKVKAGITHNSFATGWGGDNSKLPKFTATP